MVHRGVQIDEMAKFELKWKDRRKAKVDCHCTLSCIQSTHECRPKSQPFPTVALTLAHSPPTMAILVSDIDQWSSVIRLQLFQEN